MKQQRILPLAIASLFMAGFAASALAEDAPVDFHGYLRSGVGSASGSGSQQCFKLAGAGAKYRLGNECETYAELALGKTVYTETETGAKFRVETRIANSSKQFQDWESDGNKNSEFAVREMFVSAENIGLGNARVWAGKRFYDRQDVHINDYYFWDNSGPGAGIENVDAGIGKFAYAWRQNTTTSDTSVDGLKHNLGVSGHDFRLSGIKVNEGGELTLGLDIRSARKDDNDTAGKTTGGYALNVMHTQGGVFGGFNKLALQYQTGSIQGGYGYPNPGADKNDKTWRIVEQLMWAPAASKFTGMGVFIYEKQKPANGAGQTWLSLGARPTYAFTKHLGAALEVGFDQVKPDNGATRSLVKTTAALLVQPEQSFFSRPQLRLFATYAKWNDAARLAAQPQAGSTPTGLAAFNGNHGITFGAQAEAWW